MRIDKLLWSFRFFKTRSLATEVVSKNRATVNGITAKASKEVIAGDRITLTKDQIKYEFTVIQIPTGRLGAKLLPLYFTDYTPKEALDKKHLRNLAQQYYREKGEGRPTKKDRRSLDEYLDEDFLFEDFE